MITHDFLSLRESECSYSDYTKHLHSPNAIKVDDDILLYIMDTLKWIPTINPGNPSQWHGHGINYYGVTVINKTGAAKAARIFRLWAALLEEGPDTIHLTGPYQWVEGEDPTHGALQKITVARNPVANVLQTIAEFAEQAASGDFFVLHFGI